jgi:hypothetical protein
MRRVLSLLILKQGRVSGGHGGDIEAVHLLFRRFRA